MNEEKKSQKSRRLSLENPETFSILAAHFQKACAKHFQPVPKCSLICNRSTPTGFHCLTCENNSSADSSRPDANRQW